MNLTSTLIIMYFCRIISILLMYLGMLIGSFCTIFILREFYCRSQYRTSLNILIIIIFTTDCIRAFICAHLETYVLIKTWNISIINCQHQNDILDYNDIIINFCRITMTVRACFNITQPLGFIAIAYERFRTILKKNQNININSPYHQQRDIIRLKNIIIWICISFLLGIIASIYQAIAYIPSNTCYGQSDIASRIAMIIRIFGIVSSALISAYIYGKIFYIIRKHQNNCIMPIVIYVNKNSLIKNQNNSINDMNRKDIRSAKQSFIFFLSFFLCRLPSVITIFLGLIFKQQSSNTSQCYFEEFTNLFVQFIFLSTITDPLIYIWKQPRLKQKFFNFSIIPICFNNRIRE